MRELLERGAVMPDPGSVYVADDIELQRIAPQVTLYPGCRISGAETSLGPGCVLGEEAPVTLSDCQLGAGVSLKGGFFSGATILDGVRFGSAAHVRPGTLLEEQASCGHAVGLKQTLLMPFVTLGSLINFCDALLAGGTGPKHFSEVGSSYVHFNYTPRRDKATPSIGGDVPHGVMLDQPPVFLGGQGGLVGPARIAFGTTLAAGTICRHDVTEPGTLVQDAPARARATRSYDPHGVGPVARTLRNNVLYIGNLHALRAWYEHVRAPLAAQTPYDQACLRGARKQLAAMVRERIGRLEELKDHLSAALRSRRTDTREKHGLARTFTERWPERAAGLARGPDPAGPERDAFLTHVAGLRAGTPYLEAVHGLPPAARAAGTAWLESIVAATASVWPDR